MKKAPLLVELQPRKDGLRQAKRQEKIGPYFHISTFMGYPSGGYRLTHEIWSLTSKRSEMVKDFRYLSDLFEFAKQEGFFEDVAPYASGWVGYSAWRYSEENSFDEEEEYYSDAQYEADRRGEQIDLMWDSLGKYETIVYDDERFDDGGYEFSWDEPDDDEDYYWDEQQDDDDY